jgi:glycosyltransferase involved in cell wall biosynthesis
MISSSNPLISVVIPTYNHAEFLKRALQGVQSQEYDNLEVIVVDNYSDDYTDEVVGSFSSLDIKLLKINNKGVIGASRNYGIDHAKGDWIAFLDSDDFWYPTRLSICSGWFDSAHQFDVISTDELMVFSGTDKQQLLQHGPSSDDMYRDMILLGNRLSPSATLVKRSLLTRHSLKFSESKLHVTVEDYDFWMQLARHGAKFNFLRSVQGTYNIHGDNASSRIDVHSAAERSVLKMHTLELQEFETNKRKLWRKVRSRIYLGQGLRRFRQLQFWRALLLFIKSYFLSPVGIFELVWMKTKTIKKEV